MAAVMGKPLFSASSKKGVTGRMPTKRSINLISVDENKINPLKAALGIVLIVALAAAFGKFLVYDRLAEVSAAQGRVRQLQQTLDDTLSAVQDYGEVETTYAHYTYDDMTAAELGLVDRAQVVELISTIIREQDNLFDMKVYNARFHDLVGEMQEGTNPALSLRHFREDVQALGEEVAAYREQVLSWSVSENQLQVGVTGKSLESMNSIARKVEKSDIVDSCTLTTAKKDAATMAITGLPTGVQGSFQVYLMLPPEPAPQAEEVPAE